MSLRDVGGAGTLSVSTEGSLILAIVWKLSNPILMMKTSVSEMITKYWPFELKKILRTF